MSGHLFLFGYGYCAGVTARRLVPGGWQVTGSTRDPAATGRIGEDGVAPFVLGLDDKGALASVTHILATAAPTEQGDPFLLTLGPEIGQLCPRLSWLGYLSTTGVYGDAGGGWVDETSPLDPVHARGQRRIDAERDWQALGASLDLPVTIFRLPGIYGPGRSAFDNLRAGTAKRLYKEGQVFSRIHVADVAAAVEAAADARVAGVFNIADDEPAPPADVVTHAAALMGVEPPPLEDFEAARPRLSAMAIEFYSASRRISNARMRSALGVDLAYPTYRDGLRAIWTQERNGDVQVSVGS